MSQTRAAYWTDEAYRLLQAGDLRGAAKAGDRARDADRKDPRVQLLTGHLLVMCQAFDEGLAALEGASAAFQAAGQAVPPQLYCSAATALMKQFKHDEARQWFEVAQQANPDAPEPYIGIGTLEMDRGNNAEADRWFSEAARRFPSSTAMRWGRSMFRLRQGHWPAAWSDYEMRLTAPDWVARWGKHIDIPLWYGQPIPDCVLMVYHEQGMGDTIMLSRYVPFARERSQCRKLYLLIPAECVTLFEGQADWVGPKNPPDPKPEYTVSLSSLPYIHGTRLDNVPPPLPLEVAT